MNSINGGHFVWISGVCKQHTVPRLRLHFSRVFVKTFTSVLSSADYKPCIGENRAIFDSPPSYFIVLASLVTTMEGKAIVFKRNLNFEKTLKIRNSRKIKHAKITRSTVSDK